MPLVAIIIAVFFAFRFFYHGGGQDYIIKKREFAEIDIKQDLLYTEFKPIRELNNDSSYAFLFYGSDRGLYLYRSGEGAKLINESIYKKYKGGYFDFIDYEIEGKELYAVQWLRIPPTKLIILIKTNLETKNSEIMTFGEKDAPLGKPKIVGDQKGDFLLVWTDESEGYGVAYALLREGGKKTEKYQILRPAYIPFNFETYTPFYDPQEGFMLVYTTPKDIRVRRIRDGQEKVLYTLDDSKYNAVYMYGKRNKLDIYIWTTSDNSPTKQLLYLSYKDPMKDEPQKLEAKYNGGSPEINPVYGFQKPLFITYIKKAKEEALPERMNLFYSLDGKDYQKLTNPDKINDFVYTQLYSSHAVDGNRVLVVFADWRYIFPQLWASYIVDGKVVGYGPLEKPWVETQTVSWTIPLKEDIYRVYYLQKKEDGRILLTASDIRAKELTNPYSYPDLSEREKRLNEDINRFAQCQVKNNLECIYGYFDPVAQKKYPFGLFKQNSQNFNVEILDYKCTGKILGDSLIAKVECRYTYKLPPKFMGIDIKEQDRIRREVAANYWIYIKDQWRWVFQPFPGARLIDW